MQNFTEAKLDDVLTVDLSVKKDIATSIELVTFRDIEKALNELEEEFQNLKLIITRLTEDKFIVIDKYEKDMLIIESYNKRDTRLIKRFIDLFNSKCNSIMKKLKG